MVVRAEERYAGAAMWYELFLRREEAVPLKEVMALLSGMASWEETSRGIQLNVPEGTFELILHLPERRGSEVEIRGVDCLVPGGANPGLSQAACDAVFRLAGTLGLSVYDPQLGRAVTDRDVEAILARMARFASYLTETVGIDEAADLRHIEVDAPRLGLSLRTRFYLVLAGGLLLLAILARYC